MTIDLFPRLDPLAVAQSLEQLDTLISEASRPLAVGRLPATTRYSASGGSQLDLSVLADFRAQIIAIASDCGFPERGATSDRARFDLLATSLLAEFAPFESGEADRDDVWAFLATILLPDVVQWRFSGRSADRFHGGIRNTFQRLWMRAWALDCGPETGEQRWLYVRELTEDALVQLTERPSIGADPRLCQVIAKEWVETSRRIGRSPMEDVMRRAIIDLRIRNEVRMTGALSADQLDASVAEAFANAAALVDVDATSDDAPGAIAKPVRTGMQSLRALFSKREVSSRTAI
jgi:hypothetical protein